MQHETYTAMAARHQKEFNALPIHAAFGHDQIVRKLRELGLSEDEGAENYYGSNIVSLGFGTFLLKKDLPRYNEVVSRQDRERQEAMDADTTGKGFIREMFSKALSDHEYGYTGDPTDALISLGMSYQSLNQSPAMKKGFELACKEVMAAAFG